MPDTHPAQSPSSGAAVLCITCGQAAGQPPRLNRTTDGRVCPGCRERLLESLPALLPGVRRAEVEVAEQTDRPPL